MTNPKFSIIIGTYNHAKTIGMLADALNQQTFKDFEVHLCDDGSDDGTRFVFENALNKNIPYQYHVQKHKGMRLAKNVNQGIQAATGEYCVFIMGDSFPDPTYLETFSVFVQPHRMLCGVRYQVNNGIGVDLDWRLKKNYIPPENVLVPGNPCRVATGNGLVLPTAALRQFGPRDEDLEGYGGDDYEVVARLYYKGYTFWSIVDAKLYHHWHKAQETDPENVPIIKKKLFKYMGI